MERNQNRRYLQPVAIWLVLGIAGSLLLTACGASQPAEVSIEYSTEADELVIFADENTTPGGYSIGQECNHIPRLRIWGDGRTIYSDIENGRRRVLVGQTPPELINAILEKLNDMEYFSNPPDSTFTSAGSGYRIGINLKKENHNSFWSQLNPIYTTVVESFDPSILTEFFPDEGYLVVGPRLRQDIFTNAVEWPANLGFQLSDEDVSGRMVRGEPLEFLWQAINNHPEPLTGIRNGDGVYAVAVFVEGISVGAPPFRCWNK